MANSRKSRSLNEGGEVVATFERALGEILARVAVSGAGARPHIGIAFSGGLDSTVLLHLASQYAQTRDIRLTAFHVHHGLSPNADAWLAHCEQEAARCGVRLVSGAVDVSNPDGRGIEEAARIARYRALGNMCRDSGCDLLLTAHHLDDQAETVLLQLM